MWLGVRYELYMYDEATLTCPTVDFCLDSEL